MASAQDVAIHTILCPSAHHRWLLTFGDLSIASNAFKLIVNG